MKTLGKRTKMNWRMLFAAATVVYTMAATEIARSSDYYLQTKYFTPLDVRLCDPTTMLGKLTYSYLFPSDYKIGGKDFQLEQMEYTGAWQAYLDHGDLKIKHVNLSGERLRDYFVATNRRRGFPDLTPPAFHEIPPTDVEVWFRDGTTGKDTRLLSHIDLLNTVTVLRAGDPVAVPMLEAVMAGTGTISCRYIHSLDEKLHFQYEMAQQYTLELGRLTTLDCVESRFVTKRDEFRQKLTSSASSFISIDPRILGTSAGNQIMKSIETCLSDQVLDNEMVGFIKVSWFLQRAKELAQCMTPVGDPNDEIFEIIKPTEFNTITTEVLEKEVTYADKQIGVDTGAKIQIPIKGIPVPMEGWFKGSARDTKSRDYYRDWRGYDQEKGFAARTVAVHYVDAAYLESDATYRKLIEVVEPNTVSFCEDVLVVFTDSATDLIPYGGRVVWNCADGSGGLSHDFAVSFHSVQSAWTTNSRIPLVWFSDSIGVGPHDVITQAIVKIGGISGTFLANGGSWAVDYAFPPGWQEFDTSTSVYPPGEATNPLTVEQGNSLYIGSYYLSGWWEDWLGGPWDSRPTGDDIRFWTRVKVKSLTFLGS